MIEAQIDTRQLERRLRSVASRITNRRTVNRKVSVKLSGWVFRNFRQQGALAEKGWAPLKPATVKAKARKRYSMILQNTGALRKSFLPFHDNDQMGVGAVQLTDGSAPWDLARIHQEGAPEVNIPARPMLPTLRQALPIGMQIYEQFVARATREGA